MARWLAVAVLAIVILSAIPLPVHAGASNREESFKVITKTLEVPPPLGPQAVAVGDGYIIGIRDAYIAKYQLSDGSTTGASNLSGSIYSEKIFQASIIDNLVVAATDKGFYIIKEDHNVVPLKEGKYNHGLIRTYNDSSISYTLLVSKQYNQYKSVLIVYNPSLETSNKTVMWKNNTRDFLVLENVNFLRTSSGWIEAVTLEGHYIFKKIIYSNTTVKNQEDLKLKYKVERGILLDNASKTPQSFIAIIDNGTSTLIYAIERLNLTIRANYTINSTGLRGAFFDPGKNNLLIIINNTLYNLTFENSKWVEKGKPQNIPIEESSRIEFINSTHLIAYSATTGVSLVKLNPPEIEWTTGFPEPVKGFILAPWSNESASIYLREGGKLYIYDLASLYQGKISLVGELKLGGSLTYSYFDPVGRYLLLVVKKGSILPSYNILLIKNNKIIMNQTVNSNVIIGKLFNKGENEYIVLLTNKNPPYGLYNITVWILSNASGNLSIKKYYKPLEQTYKNIFDISLYSRNKHIYVAIAIKTYSLTNNKLDVYEFDPSSEKFIFRKEISLRTGNSFRILSPPWDSDYLVVVSEDKGELLLVNLEKYNIINNCKINPLNRNAAIYTYNWLSPQYLLLVQDAYGRGPEALVIDTANCSILYEYKLAPKLLWADYGAGFLVESRLDGMLALYRVHPFSVLWVRIDREARLLVESQGKVFYNETISKEKKLVLPPGTYKVTLTFDLTGIIGAPQTYPHQETVRLKPFSSSEVKYEISSQVGTLKLKAPKKGGAYNVTIRWKGGEKSLTLKRGETLNLTVWPGSYTVIVSNKTYTGEEKVSVEKGKVASIDLAKLLKPQPPPTTPTTTPTTTTQTTQKPPIKTNTTPTTTMNATKTPTGKRKTSTRNLAIGILLVIVLAVIAYKFLGVGREKSVSGRLTETKRRTPPPAGSATGTQPGGRESAGTLEVEPGIGLPSSQEIVREARPPVKEIPDEITRNYTNLRKIDLGVSGVEVDARWGVERSSGRPVLIYLPRISPLYGTVSELGKRIVLDMIDTWRRLEGVEGVPGIVSSSVEGERPYLVVEDTNGGRIDGLVVERTLADAIRQIMRIQADMRPRWTVVSEILLRLIDTLQKAHERNIIHGLMRPEDVIVKGNNSVAITNWGLSRYANPAASIAEDIRGLGLIGLGLLGIRREDLEARSPQRVVEFPLPEDAEVERTPPLALVEALYRASKGQASLEELKNVIEGLLEKYRSLRGSGVF